MERRSLFSRSADSSLLTYQPCEDGEHGEWHEEGEPEVVQHAHRLQFRWVVWALFIRVRTCECVISRVG